MPWFKAFLRNGGDQTSNLSEITMVIDYGFEDREIDISPWKEICETLASRRFPLLQRVNIYIGSFESTEEAGDILEMLRCSTYISTLRRRTGLEVHMYRCRRGTLTFILGLRFRPLNYVDLLISSAYYEAYTFPPDPTWKKVSTRLSSNLLN